MTRLKQVLLVAMLVMLNGCASSSRHVEESELNSTPQLPPLAIVGGTYAIDLPNEKGLIFHGQLKQDAKSSNGAAILYPGAGIGMLVGAIAAHAAIQSSLNASKNKDKIAKANSVLAVYESLIQHSSVLELIKRSDNIFEDLKKSGFNMVLADDTKPIDGWYVVVDPVFIMSYSQDAITVQSQVVITDGRVLDSAEDLASIESHKTITTVVQSLPVEKSKKWRKNKGEHFKNVVGDLLRNSIDLAIKDFSGLLPKRAEITSTIRYLDNGEKEIERGYLIDKTCSHLIFESLRGTIKSVNRFSPPDDGAC